MNNYRFITIVTVVVASVCFSGTAEEPELLAGQVLRLEKQVEFLKKHLVIARTEIDRLKNLCIAAGINSTVPQQGGANYRGKHRSEAWFKNMYAEFSRKIFRVADNYYSDIENISDYSLPAGYKVLQVLGDGSYLLTHSYKPTIHIIGLSMGLADGDSIPNKKLECSAIGTLQYETLAGSMATVRSYAITGIIDRDISEDEFRQALVAGVVLKRKFTTETRVSADRSKKGGRTTRGQRRGQRTARTAETVIKEFWREVP
ncbi:MAG TPA: hypothetical protein ENH94_07540 [Phycisphaerales bacterium]|nr:hypothetical protein [Phycisphaerales bacterium]